MWDIAPEFKALIVFAEHRYYGNTLPFGAESYANLSTLGYLTSEQALADFVLLINDLKGKYGDVPVVAFGGSYGGSLTYSLFSILWSFTCTCTFSLTLSPSPPPPPLSLFLSLSRNALSLDKDEVS